MIVQKYLMMFVIVGLLMTGVAYGQKQMQSPFDESVWRVEHLQEHNKIIHNYQGEQNFTHFSFNPYTSKITGNGLCNKFLGKFDHTGKNVIVKDLVTTNETCLSKDVNIQDDHFFNYLQAVKSFSIHGKILKLIDAQNRPVIIARRIK